MRSGCQQILTRNHDDVAEASRLVHLMVEGEAADSRTAAIETLSRRSGLSAGALRDLLRRRRWPKRISHSLYCRIRGHFLTHCRRRIAQFEDEIRRAEADGHPAAQEVRRLLVQAEAVAERARQLLLS